MLKKCWWMGAYTPGCTTVPYRRVSPGAIYPTIAQLEDEGLVETVREDGRKVLRLTVDGRAYATERADELAAVWAPFAEPEDDGDHANLRPVIGQTIAAVWQELFGVERVSLDDNFFELGGHSLLLIRAHARLKEVVRADLPIVALLQYPTIRALARHLTQGPSQGTTSQAAMDRAQKQREAQNRRRALAGKS